MPQPPLSPTRALSVRVRILLLQLLALMLEKISDLPHVTAKLATDGDGMEIQAGCAIKPSHTVVKDGNAKGLRPELRKGPGRPQDQRPWARVWGEQSAHRIMGHCVAMDSGPANPHGRPAHRLPLKLVSHSPISFQVPSQTSRPGFLPNLQVPCTPESYPPIKNDLRSLSTTKE